MFGVLLVYFYASIGFMAWFCVCVLVLICCCFFICLGSRCVLRLLLLGFQFFVVLMSWFSDVFLEFKCVVVLILLCSFCFVDVLGFQISFMFDVLVFTFVLFVCSWFSNLFCFGILVLRFDLCSDSLVFLFVLFFDLKLRRDVRTYSQCHIFKATAGALRHNVHSHFGIRLRQPQWIDFMWMNYSPMMILRILPLTLLTLVATTPLHPIVLCRSHGGHWNH